LSGPQYTYFLETTYVTVLLYVRNVPNMILYKDNVCYVNKNSKMYKFN